MLMITLRLTLSELDLLRHLLSAKPHDETAALLAKLEHVRREATRQRICPLCENTFTQLKSGRTGQYCSAACKQKAWRQRRHQALIRSLSSHTAP